MKTKHNYPSTQPAEEQYELQEKPAYNFQMNRRTFFGALGSGLAVTFSFAQGISSELLADSPSREEQVGAWIHVGEDGIITVYTGKAEVGQNIRTSLAQIVAEELPVEFNKIQMVMGDTLLTPYDMGTFGSLSTPVMGPKLQKAAATAREILIDLASKELKVDRKDVFIEKGIAKTKSSGQFIPIGQLTKGREMIQTVDEKIPTKKIQDWKIAGTTVAKVNGVSFVTGRHKYVSDMKLPDMLYGKILRAPSYGATLDSVDVSAARAMRNVTVVQDGNFVGVAAPDIRTATEAIKSIKATWKETPQPSRKEIFDYFKKKSQEPSGRNNENEGDVSDSLAKADIKIAQSFVIDYIAHVPLETRAGVAQWSDDKLTVWVGTQRPFGVQEELAKIFSMQKENVRVIQPDTGSGYGGKHTGEAGIEAARLAKEARRPVRVTWTREEEFAWAYFRPAGVIDVKAGASKDGIVTSWEFHNYNSGGAGIWSPYEFANRKIQFHPVESPLRQGSYRGLAATANTFARECIMNDLAIEAKIDPLDFRLKNLSETRMKDVLNAAAEKFGWKNKNKPGKGRGIGIACGAEKGSFVATCVEVAVDDEGRDIKVVRASVAFECGAIINPNHLENQIQGSVVQGLGGALFEYIDFKDGKLLNGSMSKYRVPRFSDIPQLEIVMLDRKDIEPLGAGETPILAIAPAIRNAVLMATGKKLYGLPLQSHIAPTS
jgi:nicotinate dehydrogenase subunit B